MVTGIFRHALSVLGRDVRSFRSREGGGGTWWKLALTSLIVTSVVTILRAVGMLSGIETRWVDLMAEVDRPSFDAPITVVAITDEDFYNPDLFDGVSPLHPEVLARALGRVLEHRPRGVVLDIQIHPTVHEPPERARARQRLYRLLETASASGGPPIVLVRDVAAEEVERSASDEIRAQWEDLTGNRRLVWADPGLGYLSGRLRDVPRYHSNRHPGAEVLPTVLGASIGAFRLVPQRSLPWWSTVREDLTSPWRIRFTGHFLEDTLAISPHRITMGTILSSPVVAGQHSLLTDRIVLIGGTYRAGRDLQSTAVGEMAGVYAWAEAIASWIRHDALREPAPLILFALESLIGVLAGLLLLRLGPAYGLLAALPVVAILAVLCSILTFGSGVLFVNFLPACLGVYLHYQIEVHREIGRLKGQLRRLSESRASPEIADGR